MVPSQPVSLDITPSVSVQESIVTGNYQVRSHDGRCEFPLTQSMASSRDFQTCFVSILTDAWRPPSGGHGELFGDWKATTSRGDTPREVEVSSALCVLNPNSSHGEYPTGIISG